MTDMSAFRVAPQSEFKARDELIEQGIVAAVPMELRWKRVRHHQKTMMPREVPLASGYVFAYHNNPDEPLPATRFTRNRVGRCKSSEMLRLYRHNGRKINEPHDANQTPLKKYAVGDRVSIKVGLYADLKGTVVQDRGRALIVQPDGGSRTIAVSLYHLQRPPT